MGKTQGIPGTLLWWELGSSEIWTEGPLTCNIKRLAGMYYSLSYRHFIRYIFLNWVKYIDLSQVSGESQNRRGDLGHLRPDLLSRLINIIYPSPSSNKACYLGRKWMSYNAVRAVSGARWGPFFSLILLSGRWPCRRELWEILNDINGIIINPGDTVVFSAEKVLKNYRNWKEPWARG